MPRILIADDNLDLLAIISSRFRSMGFEVVEARNGAEAIQAAKEREPDAIVLDVMMPELNGYQVCRRLKEDPALRRIPVVLLTAKEGSADLFWASEVGADLYLNKPIDPARVVRRVEELLQKSSCRSDK